MKGTAVLRKFRIKPMQHFSWSLFINFGWASRKLDKSGPLRQKKVSASAWSMVTPLLTLFLFPWTEWFVNDWKLAIASFTPKTPQFRYSSNTSEILIFKISRNCKFTYWELGLTNTKYEQSNKDIHRSGSPVAIANPFATLAAWEVFSKYTMRLWVVCHIDDDQWQNTATTNINTQKKRWFFDPVLSFILRWFCYL